MEGIITSIIDSLRSRLKNPLIGSFLIVWVGFNWRPLLYVLMSEDSFRVRIIHINAKYSDWCLNLWCPLLIALIYVVAIPYILLLLDFLVKWANEKRKTIKYDSLAKISFAEKNMFDAQNSSEISKNNLTKTQELSDANSNLSKKNNEIESQLRKVIERLEYANLKLSLGETNVNSFDVEIESFKSSIASSNSVLSVYNFVHHGSSKPSNSEIDIAQRAGLLVVDDKKYDFEKYSVTDKGKYFYYKMHLRD